MTETWIAFETEVGRGDGHLRLQDGKAWTLLTTMDDSRVTRKRKVRAGRGRRHRAEPDRETWLETHARGRGARLTTQPYASIIGGGQGGIGLGARLRQLGVPTIIIDRNPRPATLAQPLQVALPARPGLVDHLPYIEFPENWPVFSPKDKFSDWLEMYAKVMELNYWGSHRSQERDLGARGAEDGPCRSSARSAR